MPKSFTTLKEVITEVSLFNSTSDNCTLQPKKETLDKILQFAAGYRAVSTTDQKVIDICLN